MVIRLLYGLKLLVIFMWLDILFSSIRAKLCASNGGRISVRIFLSMSEFFMLFVKISLIHSSCPADMSHFLAIWARAPQNCSNDSLSRGFLFNTLCLSNVKFVFLAKAAEKFSQNSSKEIWSIFTFVNF